MTHPDDWFEPRLVQDPCRWRVSIWDPAVFDGRFGWWHRFVVRVFFAGRVTKVPATPSSAWRAGG